MLNLYIKNDCPYCQNVVTFLKSTPLKYKLLDITKSHFLDELLKLGGKKQVPFLFDSEKNVMMYESKDIIEYLKTL